MTGLVVPDAGQDPAGYVLTVADLREARAKAFGIGDQAFIGGWLAGRVDGCGCGAGEPGYPHEPHCGWEPLVKFDGPGEHVPAEANPAHGLAEVALWRGIVKRHEPLPSRGPEDDQPMCAGCRDSDAPGDEEMS